MFIANIYITLKEGVFDPQGTIIKHSLETLGFKEVSEVRMGKFVRLRLNHQNKEEAKKEVEQICKKVLTNPVIETYRFEIIDSLTF
ncbi:MAG: phosphoribosylformylglycinamidine synthase subunit PurS [Candidatus Edwardsbacteria bacterium]